MVEVRALGPDDWETTRSLRLAALLDAPEAFGGSYEESSQRAEADWRDWPAGGQVFAAWIGDEPAGMACWYPDKENPKAGQLVAMWVARAARGTGAAGALIEAVVQRARAADNAVLELVVCRTNAAAHRAYLKSGFVETGPSDRWPDCIVMRRDLRGDL